MQIEKIDVDSELEVIFRNKRKLVHYPGKVAKLNYKSFHETLPYVCCVVNYEDGDVESNRRLYEEDYCGSEEGNWRFKESSKRIKLNEPDVKVEAKPEEKPEAKPEPKPEVKPETKPELKGETTDEEKTEYININMINYIISDRINPESNKRMCANYYNTCKSLSRKELQHIYLPDGTKKICYLSPVASFVHWKHMNSFKTESAKQARRLLRTVAVCNDCREGTQRYVNLERLVNLCCLCKETAYQQKTPHPICGNCIMTSTRNSKEHCLKISFNKLKYIFGFCDIITSINRNIADGMQIDCTVEGKVKNIRFCILIEKHEDQHLSGNYTRNTESRKLFLQNKDMLEKYNKVFQIVFNPNSPYKVSEFEKKETHFVTRIITLRQWIIWYITEIADAPKFLLLYLFFNHDNPLMILKNYQGFGYTDKAPYANNSQEWLYCYDPTEFLLNIETIPANLVYKNWPFSDLDIPLNIRKASV